MGCFFDACKRACGCSEPAGTPKKKQKKMPEHPQQKLRMFRHVPLTLRPTDGSVGLDLERNRKNGFLNIREKKIEKRTKKTSDSGRVDTLPVNKNKIKSIKKNERRAHW